MKRKPFTALRFHENGFLVIFSVYTLSFLLCFFLALMGRGVERVTEAVLFMPPLLAVYLPVLFLLHSEEGRESPLGAQRIKKECWTAEILFVFCAFALGTGGALLCGKLGLPLFFYGMALPTDFSLLSLFAVVVFGAFCEEILLRGVMQTHLATLGEVASVLVSASLSAALGLSLSSLPLLLAAGGLCAIARHRTDSLWGSVFVSAVARLGIYLVSADVWQGLVARAGVVLLSVLLLSFATVAFVAVFFVSRQRYTNRTVCRNRKECVTACLLALLFLGLSVGASFLISTL